MPFYSSDDSEDSDQGPANDEPEVDSLAAAIQYEVSIIIIVISVLSHLFNSLHMCIYSFNLNNIKKLNSLS